MSKPWSIKIEPALPTDLFTIASLENLTFWDEPFSALAFGPHRGSETSLSLRAKDLASHPKRKGETFRVMKAVDEKGEIVGAAVYFFLVERNRGGDELLQEEKEEEEESKGKDLGEGWGDGANVRFCEDTLVKGDEFMLKSCEGGDYAKLGALVVSPLHQRRGVGTQLLELFLKETDELRLQAVLGASKEGRGLYKRYGFRDYEVMELKMWEYEGGEGMALEEHVIMHRPVRGK